MGKLRKHRSRDGAKRAPRRNRKVYSDELPLPGELLKQYPQQFVVYSARAGRVIGASNDEAEAFRQAEASGVEGPWHIAFSDWTENGEVIWLV